MKLDYHMHFENGDYDLDWAEGFFDAAKKRDIDEIGITEHTHTFPEFKDLYYDSLQINDSAIGKFQQGWLKRNKFKHTLDEYFAFMEKLRQKHPVKIGIEVCNFKDQRRVKKILDQYPFDYIIGSVHFLQGYVYDSKEIWSEWESTPLNEIFDLYTEEALNLINSGIYDVLGHPFNVRMLGKLQDSAAQVCYEKVAAAMKERSMAVDVNTGTLYRYPLKEISPCNGFMVIAKKYDLPLILSSDAHQPEDCGAYIDDAVNYVRSFGYKTILRYSKRQHESVSLPFDEQ